MGCATHGAKDSAVDVIAQDQEGAQPQNEAAGDEHGKSSSFQRGVKMLQTAAAGPAEHIGMDLIE